MWCERRSISDDPFLGSGSELEFMLEHDKNIEEVENWVKLHDEAVSKYDTNVEEIETRLNYITKLEEESAIEQEDLIPTRSMNLVRSY